MIFGFPVVDHKHYNKNFLKTVVFQVTFDQSKKLIEQKNAVIALLLKSFQK